MMNVGQWLTRVRKESPLVHNMTNVVVTNFVANGLLAVGASPVMAYAKEEVADMVRLARALVLNIGTLNETDVEAMLIAGKAANEANIPVIFDPVGAGATAYRTETARRILREVNISILRGNASEIASIAGEQVRTKGVDAGDVQGDLVDVAKKAALMFRSVVVVTGKDDVVTDGERIVIVSNGDAMLTKVTGTGCLLSSVLGAFAGIGDDMMMSSVAALAYYGVAAEKAAKQAKAPGSFQLSFLNALHETSAEEVDQYARIQGE
ncbi:hydroxyethylthiazole kinase [Anoxybacillus sp. CHMUD]|uniref:hydroxyethylthiazole kinase n=1 Tax=Anoxybacillus sp. CHMUD TaxID=2508870 RepID=UPI0010097A6A|nr:hydroxyethylthiazole kinase [Anoxybacillus sp. CHMUD]NNU89736.1 hydroxyethylthiazole kinase [Anoxybacillus sp. CHMUD]QAV26822.1 hydroxyethylthiazole kinase [Neobacillus thermocopriae]